MLAVLAAVLKVFPESLKTHLSIWNKKNIHIKDFWPVSQVAVIKYFLIQTKMVAGNSFCTTLENIKSKIKESNIDID